MFLLLVTIVSLLAATIMSIVAWLVSREERRRSRARIEKLAEEISEDRAAPRIRAVVGSADMRSSRSAFGVGTQATSNLFQSAPVHAGSHHAIRLAIGGLVVATVIALVVVMSGGSRAVPAAARPAGGTPDVQISSRPIELVALGHERNANGLIVRGVVRNPTSGSKVGPMTAVVFLFDHDGGFLASGRGALESPVLVPGGESTFSVTVPTASKVERYRVSFRVGDQMVPHVDRRGRNGPS
jgi:hypothetical protein